MKISTLLLLWIPVISLPAQIDGLQLITGSDKLAKMEFAYSTTRAGKEYVKYMLRVSEYESVLFDIGVETDAPLKSGPMPSSAIRCDVEAWNHLGTSGREDILDGKRPVVLLIPAGVEGYRVATVFATEQVRRAGEVYAFRNPDLEFVFDASRNNLKTGEGLSLSLEASKTQGSCPLYIFRKHSRIQPGIFKDLVWSPQLGVVRENYAGEEGAYSLLRVGGKSQAEYLAVLCPPVLPVVATSTDVMGSPPSSSVRPEGLTPGAFRQHIVVRGETFFGIARQYQVLPGELMDLNPAVDPNKMALGSLIRIPNTGNRPSMPSGTYVLREGDLPVEIANRHGISLENLLAWNPNLTIKIAGDYIFVTNPNPSLDEIQGLRTKGNGSQVMPPSTTRLWESTDGRHLVKAGETVASLAQAYGFTEERFRQMNRLAAKDEVKEGQILFTQSGQLPASPEPSPQQTPAVPGAPAPQSIPTMPAEPSPAPLTPYFDIQDGKIKALFPEPEVIGGGEEASRPAKGASSRREIYIVQQDDTLSAIARRFNVTEERLRALNKLSPGEILLPRQRLFLD